MSKINITRIEKRGEHLRITKTKGDRVLFWDTSIVSGEGSLDEDVENRLRALVEDFGPDSVAEAIDELGIYPPMLSAEEALQIEDEITWVD